MLAGGAGANVENVGMQALSDVLTRATPPPYTLKEPGAAFARNNELRVHVCLQAGREVDVVSPGLFARFPVLFAKDPVEAGRHAGHHPKKKG